MTKPILSVLNGQSIDTIPFWYMRQAGRYLPEYRELRKTAGSFLDMCFNPEFATEVTLQPLRRFNMEAAILFADILLIPQALGQDLKFIPGTGPVLTPVRDYNAVSELYFDTDKLHAHMAPVYQTVANLADALPADKTLIGFAGAPWTVATYMVEGGSSKDFQHIKKFMYTDPKGFSRLIDMIVEATAAYLIKQIDAGAEVVQIFDSWAGALPEGPFDSWSIAPTRKLVEKIRAAHPGVPIIGFPKGAGMLYPRYVRETGVTAVSFDHTLPLSFVRDEIQPLCPVQGGLDNGALLAGGDGMISAADNIIKTLSGGPFIFNLGHGVIKDTPPEHVAALSEYIKSVRV